MANRTQQQIVDALNALCARAVNVVEGTIAGAAQPGGSITFTYRNPVDRQTYTARGIAWNQCVPSKVSAVKLEDGSWLVIGAHESSVVRSSVHTDRRARPQPENKGKVKILFSTIEGDERVFWVGGDRAVPSRIYSIPANSSVTTAILNNAGDGNLYFAGLRYLVGGVTHFCVVSQSEWDLVPTVQNLSNYALDDPSPSRTDGASQLKYIGNGFWTQLPPSQNTAYISQHTPMNRTRAPFVPISYGNETYGFSSSATMSDTMTYSAYSPLISGGGSGTYNSALTDTYFDLATQGRGFPGLNEEHITAQFTKSYSFSAPLFNVFNGELNQNLGPHTYSYSETFQSDLSPIQIVQNSSGQSVPSGNPRSQTESFQTQSNSTHQWVSAVTPLVKKTSVIQAISTSAISRAGNPYGSYPSSGSNSESATQIQYVPLMLGDSESGIYQKITAIDSYSYAVGSDFMHSPPPATTEYFLIKDEIEIKLGGEFPKNASDPTIVEFRATDNLVDGSCYRVQMDATIFSASRLPIDAYSLSATSDKRTLEVKVYSITEPSSGLPTDTAQLAQLSAALKGNLPVAIGNLTVHSASYRP